MAVYWKEKAGQRRENKKNRNQWRLDGRRRENREKSRKEKNDNLRLFSRRRIVILCMLLLVLWRSESPAGNRQQPEVICLMEGKNVRIMNQNTGLDSQRELLGSVQGKNLESDEGSQYESNEKGNGDKKITLPESDVQTLDNQQIWTTDTSVEIFETLDQNAAGEPTVQSSNSDKVIAPGTSGTYIFFLQNTGKMKVDYKVSLKAGWELEGKESPLEIRMADDNGWLAPCRSGWQSISNLSHIPETGQLLPTEKARYILYWRWAYERGKDEEDTFLGNETEDTLHTIVIHTEAVQSISENAGDADPGKKNDGNTEDMDSGKENNGNTGDTNGRYEGSVKADITKTQEKDENIGQTKAEDRNTQSADAVRTADQMSPVIWIMVLTFAELVFAVCLIVIWLRKRRSYDEK